MGYSIPHGMLSLIPLEPPVRGRRGEFRKRQAMALIEDLLINLAASTIFVGTGYLGKERIVPLIRGYLRRLPRLDGTAWRRAPEGERPDRSVSIMKVRQAGARIFATIERSDRKVQRTFKYSGLLSGHQIVFTWEDTASPEEIIGALVLHISTDLLRLTGSSVYFSHKQGKVISVPCVYERLPRPSGI